MTKTDQLRKGFVKQTIIKNSKALIFPGSTVAGYAHINSLGLAGIHVVALSPKNCSNFRSRYVQEKHIVPDPTREHENFVSWLIDYGKRQRYKPVLFLVEDLYAYLASLYQDDLKPYFLYPYIQSDKMKIFFNKKWMYKQADAARIMYPESFFSPLTDDEVAQWQHYPAVLKPLVSRFTFAKERLIDVVKFPTLFGGKAIRASNERELRHYISALHESNIEYCIQRYIPGENRNLATNMFVADWDGSIPSCFIHRKYRQQPADFGTRCVGESEYIPCLHEYSEQFCKATGYSGPGSMEFKKNQNDGEWYLMEINPRLGFSIGMGTRKGVNMPLQMYLLSTGQSLFLEKQREKGRYWIDVLGDYDGLKWRQKRKEWRSSLFQIIKPYLYFNEAVFNWKDPIPGVTRIAERIIMKKINIKRLILKSSSIDRIPK